MEKKDIVLEHLERGEDPIKMCVDYTAEFFRYMELAWWVLDEEYEWEQARDLYSAFTWGSEECGAGFRALVEKLDYEVNDLESLGNACAAHYCDMPIPLAIAELDDDKVVLEADFCANPAFGGRPWDRPIDQYRYHYSDGWIGTCALFRNYYKVVGMEDELDFHMEGAICVGTPKCRFVIEKAKD